MKKLMILTLVFFSQYCWSMSPAIPGIDGGTVVIQTKEMRRGYVVRVQRDLDEDIIQRYQQEMVQEICEPFEELALPYRLVNCVFEYGKNKSMFRRNRNSSPYFLKVSVYIETKLDEKLEKEIHEITKWIVGDDEKLSYEMEKGNSVIPRYGEKVLHKVVY